MTRQMSLYLSASSKLGRSSATLCGERYASMVTIPAGDSMKFDRNIQKVQLFSCFIRSWGLKNLDVGQQKVPTAQAKRGLSDLELKLRSLFDRSADNDLANLTRGKDCV